MHRRAVRTLGFVSSESGQRRSHEIRTRRCSDAGQSGPMLDAFADVAARLTATAWSTQSPCPGWTAGDVVAHVPSLESELHGDPVPDHEPDWAALPHVTTPFGKYTEVPVDWYRSKGRDVVLAELREIIEWRKQDLADISDDPDETVTGPAGWQTTRTRMIRTRSSTRGCMSRTFARPPRCPAD